MVLTSSRMLPLGTKAPDFFLPDVTTNEKVSLASFQGKKGLLVMFICSHCPYVKHLEKELAQVANQYVEKGLGAVAISSNDADHYPDDAPFGLKAQAEKLGFKFPYLHDQDQSVAHAYQAACTPDLYVFDAEFKLAYRGQFDDSRPGNEKQINGKHLKEALDAVLSGNKPSEEQLSSVGCNIKWKPGNQPR